MSKITQIVVHGSDSEFGDVEEIRKWHLYRGWRDIGYNAVILNGKRKSHEEYQSQDDGLVEVGRALDISPHIEAHEHGAHALGYNHNSIGVCMVGPCDGLESYSEAQLWSLYHFIMFYRRVVPEVRIVGHNDLNHSKTCPGFQMVDFWNWIRVRI